jgi:hypothetical protein
MVMNPSRYLAAALLAPCLLAGAPILVESSGAAGFLLAVHDTLAQVTIAQVQDKVPDTAPITSSRTINLTEENRHVIREIVFKDMAVKKTPGGTSVSIGDPVPPGVVLQTFPALVFEKVPSLRSHSFFVQGDEVVVVDPKDNKVADVVK